MIKNQSSFCSAKNLTHKEINNHFVANDDPGGGNVLRVYEGYEMHFVGNLGSCVYKLFQPAFVVCVLDVVPFCNLSHQV